MVMMVIIENSQHPPNSSYRDLIDRESPLRAHVLHGCFMISEISR